MPKRFFRYARKKILSSTPKRRKRALTLNDGISETRKRAEDLLRGKERIVVGITGPASAGKSFIADKLGWPTMRLDDYYKDVEHVDGKGLSFFDPASNNLERAASDIRRWLRGEPFEPPMHDMSTHRTVGKREPIKPGRVLVVEGLFTLLPELKDFIDLKVYVDSPTRKKLLRSYKRAMSGERRKKSLMRLIREGPRKKRQQYEHIYSKRDEADIIIKN